MLKVSKVLEKIYLIEFKDHYDLTMHFVRYQEYYENPQFKSRQFELIDLMEWYSKTYGNGVFTYPKDWAGFNLPLDIMFEVHNLGIKDPNRYDRLMLSLAEKIKAESGEGTYIIGISEVSTALDHEIAHGLWYTNLEYKTKMSDLINNLPNKITKHINKYLTDTCYHPDVFDDETQAYMSTGLVEKINTKEIRGHMRKFKKVFKQYYKGNK